MNYRKENAVLKDAVYPCLSIYKKVDLVSHTYCIFKTSFHAAFRGMQTLNFWGYWENMKTVACVDHIVVFNRELI